MNEEWEGNSYRPDLTAEELRIICFALWSAWNERHTCALEDCEEGQLRLKLGTLYPWLKQGDWE